MATLRNRLLFFFLFLFPAFSLAQTATCEGPYQGQHLTYDRLQIIISAYQALPKSNNSNPQKNINLY